MSLCATLHGGAASLGATLRGVVASLGAALRRGVPSMNATQRRGAASLCATLCGDAASLGATLCGGAASLGAALSRGRRGTITSASHDGGAVPLSGVALCKCMMSPSSYDKGAVPSSHDEGAVPSSPDEGVVQSLSWGVSVSCASSRVLALHARGAEVVVVVDVAVGAVTVMMGVAVGAVAGEGRRVGWCSRGSSCRVESSLAPRAAS